ncbi:MAG: hypothetical protein ACK5NT_11760, partial [Pyrinomonadaceae bacterium]
MLEIIENGVLKNLRKFALCATWYICKAGLKSWLNYSTFFVSKKHFSITIYFILAKEKVFCLLRFIFYRFRRFLPALHIYFFVMGYAKTTPPR